MSDTTCPYCQQRPIPHRKGSRTCGDAVCRQARKAATSRPLRYAEAERRRAERFGLAPARVVVPRRPDTTDRIEMAFQEARAARLAEERRNGQRRYTITAIDAQAQRGPGHFGNPGADNQGEGWS